MRFALCILLGMPLIININIIKLCLGVAALVTAIGND